MICLWCCQHWIRTAPRVQGDRQLASPDKKPDSISSQRTLAENIQEKIEFSRIIISVLCVTGKVTLKTTKREESAGCVVPAVFYAVPKATGPCQVRLSTRTLSHPETHWTSTHWSQQSEDRNGEEHLEHTGNQPPVSHRLRRSELRFTRTFSSHETGCSEDSSRLAQGQMSQHRRVH